MTVAYRDELFMDGERFMVHVRAESADGRFLGDVRREIRPGDEFRGWTWEELWLRGPGEFEIPKPGSPPEHRILPAASAPMAARPTAPGVGRAPGDTRARGGPRAPRQRRAYTPPR